MKINLFQKEYMEWRLRLHEANLKTRWIVTGNLKKYTVCREKKKNPFKLMQGLSRLVILKVNLFNKIET